GNIYVIDWYDKQACHTNDSKIWDRSNGRIYKVSYRGTKPASVDLNKKSDKELVELQLHSNDWYVRHARRLLQERAATRKLDAAVHAEREKILFSHADETRRLRAVWALHVTGGLTEPRYRKTAADAGPHVRAWTYQLVIESKVLFPISGIMTAAAQGDPSPVVRLAIASALQRPVLADKSAEDHWVILKRLFAHAEDATDHNLPLMDWYAAEPLAGKNPSLSLKLAAEAKLPQLLPFMVRRIASTGQLEAAELLVNHLNGTEDAAVQLTVLRALQEGLKGRRQVAMPAAWPGVYAKLSRSPPPETRTLGRA